MAENSENNAPEKDNIEYSFKGDTDPDKFQAKNEVITKKTNFELATIKKLFMQESLTKEQKNNNISEKLDVEINADKMEMVDMDKSFDKKEKLDVDDGDREIVLEFYRSFYRQERKIFSQNKEDGVIMALLSFLKTTSPGFYVEFGTETGAECNTRNLRENHNWKGRNN